jgi:hypothetical protein
MDVWIDRQIDKDRSIVKVCSQYYCDVISQQNCIGLKKIRPSGTGQLSDTNIKRDCWLVQKVGSLIHYRRNQHFHEPSVLP